MRVCAGLIMAGLAAAVASAAPPAFEGPATAARTVTLVDGVSIEAAPAGGPYVDALVARLRKPMASIAADLQRFGFAELRAQREHVLRRLAERFGTPGPTESMFDAFDRFSSSAGAIYHAMMNRRPRHFSLWRKPDLIARLRSGQSIPGFALDGEDVHIAIEASFNTPPGTGARPASRGG